MKKNLFVAILLLVSVTAFSRVKFGIKGGMAFGYDGTLTQTISNIKESSGKNNIGWHAGVFSRISFLGLFVQPELYYSSMKTEFDSTTEGNFSTRTDRLDIPVLAGVKLLGIARLYAGPVFSTSLNEDISLSDFKDVKSDDFSMAGQVGVGVDVSSLTFDVRYEFGFNDNTTEFINTRTNQEFTVEKRPNSLLLSVGYKF